MREAEREGGQLPPEAQARGSILRPAVSEDEIAAAEERLGVRFPELYRAFLKISNGAHAGEHGPDMLLDLGYPDAELIPTGLLPVQDVVRLEEGHPVLWRVYHQGRGWRPEEAPSQEPFKAAWPVMIIDTTPLRDALMISHAEQNSTLMLVPTAGEWQLWVEEYTGPQGFASFASWLRWQLHRFERG